MADKKTEIKSIFKISFRTFQTKTDVSGIDAGRYGVEKKNFMIYILAQVL